MSFFYLLYLIPLVIIAVIGLIVFSVVRAIRGKRKVEGIRDKGWYLQIFLSKEDAVSQIFFLLSLFFFGITLLTFNTDLGSPLSWQTILLFTVAVGIAITYYFKVVYTLAVSIVGFVGWWTAQAVIWLGGKDIKGIALFTAVFFIALLYYLIGRIHEKETKFKRFAMVYSVLGLISVTVALFFFSTKLGLRTLGELTKGGYFFASWEITFSILIFLILLIGALIYAFSKKLIFKGEILVIVFLLILFSVITFFPEQNTFLLKSGRYGYYSGAELSATGNFWAIFFNIVIFLQLVGIIFLGYLKRENWLINLGVLAIFILIFVKYFDWFFTFLDKSIFFIGAGILLFVVGWFMEKGRRYMISGIKDETIKQGQ